MHRDSLVQRRLDELAAKAKAIAVAKYSIVVNPRTGRKADRVYLPDAQGWSTSVLSLLQQAFGAEGVHFKHFQSLHEKFDGWESSFQGLYSVFLAAKEDYEGGYLFSLRGLVKAEVLTDALEQAQDLLKAGYKDPACVLAGVSLEITVKDLAVRHAISPSKLDKMNVELCRAGVYNVAKQKQVTAWADLRNKAAHGEWSGYTEADVRDFLVGVQRFVSDYL